MLKTKFASSGFKLKKFWQDFFDVFSIRKKNIHWGTVYDSVTKQPIDPVLVEIIDFKTKEARQTAITDLWGRYGFIVEQGDYLIQVKRGNYSFPTKLIKKKSDGIYDNIYRGERITILGKWDLVSPNIPLDPTGQDFNQMAKMEFAKIYPWREIIFRWLLNVAFWGGLAIVTVYFFLNEGPIETIILIIFILLLMLRLLLPARPITGRIFSSKTGEPLGFVDIELFIPGKSQVLIAKTRSAPGGKFFLKARQGKFTIKITDPVSGKVLGEGTATLGFDGLFNAEIYI